MVAAELAVLCVHGEGEHLMNWCSVGI